MQRHSESDARRSGHAGAESNGRHSASLQPTTIEFAETKALPPDNGTESDARVIGGIAGAAWGTIHRSTTFDVIGLETNSVLPYANGRGHPVRS